VAAKPSSSSRKARAKSVPRLDAPSSRKTKPGLLTCSKLVRIGAVRPGRSDGVHFGYSRAGMARMSSLATGTTGQATTCSRPHIGCGPNAVGMLLLLRSWIGLPETSIRPFLYSGVAGRLRPSYARMLAARFSNAGAGCIQGSEPLRVPAPRGEPEHECDAPCNVVDDLAAALQWDVTDASGKEALEKIYRVAREKVGTGRIQKLVRAAASSGCSSARPIERAMLHTPKKLWLVLFRKRIFKRSCCRRQRRDRTNCGARMPTDHPS
jgi:hypothetical protein